MRRISPRFLRVHFGVFFVACCFASPVAAVTVRHHDLDPNHELFGNLKQTDVPDCGNGLFACGPTAAVNSFAFLQNKFPDLYDNSLIPDLNLDGEYNYQDLVLTAVALGGDDYMMCVACNGGTFVDKFISGKRRWIEERAPGTTIFKDRQNPNWDFLYGELWDMEDVELLFGFYDDAGARIGGHYVTLTKFWWDDENDNSIVEPSENAMIGFVDPATGMLRMSSLVQNALGALLHTDYGVGLAIGGTLIAATRIDWAISESPIPEPAAVLLAVVGIAGVALRRRRSVAWHGA